MARAAHSGCLLTPSWCESKPVHQLLILSRPDAPFIWGSQSGSGHIALDLLTSHIKLFVPLFGH